METRFTLEIHVYELLCEQFVSILVIEDVDIVCRLRIRLSCAREAYGLGRVQCAWISPCCKGCRSTV